MTYHRFLGEKHKIPMSQPHQSHPQPNSAGKPPAHVAELTFGDLADLVADPTIVEIGGNNTWKDYPAWFLHTKSYGKSPCAKWVNQRFLNG